MALVTFEFVAPPPAGTLARSGGASASTYAQRVFSSGLNAWCYYNGALNATPLSSETTPNWTGAITAWQVLGRLT